MWLLQLNVCTRTCSCYPDFSSIGHFDNGARLIRTSRATGLVLRAVSGAIFLNSQYTCHLLLMQCLTGDTETWCISLSIFISKSWGPNDWLVAVNVVRRSFFAVPLKCFVPSSVNMSHPMPLPAWWKCRM